MRNSRLALLLWVTALFATQGASANDMKLLHSERSLYREVLVYQTGDVRCICFTRYCRIGRQTCQDVKQPSRIVMNYPQMMLGALFAQPDPKSILIIGLGGGTIPRALREVVPQARIDVVEIDPAVVKVARRYFDLGDSSAVNVIEADGRVQVKKALREQQRYDLIMLDAFDHEYIPEHLLTQEFLKEVKGLLTPNGVLVANTFSSSRLYDHESTTYASVFPQFFNLKRENRVIIASNGSLPDDTQLKANSERFEKAFESFGFSSGKLLPLFSRKQDWERDARILTDQYSPANLLNLGKH
ncbi:spermidine synthase [Steroidobacter sp.]|uniref:spermidine synthase n=1 Tax=Steroidobacter sp. TaxID=1978227 RepID=UPI001A3D9FB9|nr:fused MFS/spermidine synthase [Steroidobacter sp.]MBL8269617.1 fused MFS/spermidine synthase [Steroidobacter sp.]